MKNADGKALICDADGTLLQSWDWIIGAALRVKDEFGLNFSKEEVTNHFLSGTALYAFYEKLAGSPLLAEKCIKAHRGYQELPESVESISLYPGVKETLERLHAVGVKFGIATSRTNSRLLKITLQKFGILHLFETMVSAEDVTKPKPDPECLFLIMEHLGTTKEKTFFVGDTTADTDAGHAAGIHTIAALYGFGGMRLAGSWADSFINSFSEVEQIVLADAKSAG